MCNNKVQLWIFNILVVKSYLNADLVMNAPPVKINIESTNAKVKSNLLNNVILLDIDLSVKQVKIFPTNPKDPTIQTDMPEE